MRLHLPQGLLGYTSCRVADSNNTNTCFTSAANAAGFGCNCTAPYTLTTVNNAPACSLPPNPCNQGQPGYASCQVAGGNVCNSTSPFTSYTCTCSGSFVGEFH